MQYEGCFGFIGSGGTFFSKKSLCIRGVFKNTTDRIWDPIEESGVFLIKTSLRFKEFHGVSNLGCRTLEVRSVINSRIVSAIW